MAILKLITQPSSVMDKAIASAAGPLKVMKAPTGMNFAIEIDVDKAIIKSIEKDPLLQSIMVDKAGEIYEDLVSRIGKNLQATDKGAVTLKDAGQTEKLEKLITVVNKGIEEARKIAVDRAQKEVLKAWDELVKARKEYTKYKIKIGVKITTGLAGLAVSIGLLAGGVVSFGASSIPGIVGMVKSTAAIGAQIVSASQEIETAQKRLDGNLKTIEQRFVNAKGEFTKKGKSQEAGAALLEQFLGTSGPFAVVASIKGAVDDLGTIKSKFGGLKVNSHDAAKNLHSILEKLGEARKKFFAEVDKQVKKDGSSKAAADRKEIEKRLDLVLDPFTAKVDAALRAVIEYQSRYKTAEPRITVAEKRVAELAKLKGKGWKVFENVLVFSDLALSFADPGQYAKVGESLAGILPSVGGLAADKITKKVFEGTFLEG